MSSPIATIAQALGALGPAALCGYGAAASILSVPSLHKAPAAIGAQAWRAMYTTGARTSPPFGILIAAAQAFCSYTAYQQSSGAWRVWLVAAGSGLGMIPFTLMVMMPTNNKLSAMAKKGEAREEVNEQEYTALLQKWKTLNLVRSVIVGAGTVAAWTAAMS
ncbi:MAG: hypothetical protein M1831_007307 [Alyxoria varia]|nr:MAG: hypothetical protein M1831_007307 [Alyxoria varia]